GFLRIFNGTEPLDATGVHPESYEATKVLLDKLNFTTKDISFGGISDIKNKVININELAEDIGVGAITLKDILKELEKPGRDPREEMPKPMLRTDVLDMKDLEPGMVL